MTGGDAGRSRVVVVLTGALLGFAALLRQRLVDQDLFGHLFFGRAAILAGHVLKTDPYAFVPHNPVWYNHEWLWEVSWWQLYATLGDVSLLLAKALCGAVAFGALALLGEVSGSNPVVTLAFCALAAAGIAPDVHVRPYLATYSLYPVVLYGLSQVEAHPRLAVPGLAVVIGLWANLHAGFVVGLGAVGLYAAAALVQRRPVWRLYALVGVLGVLASCVNPYGIEYWPFVLRAVTMRREYITEFRPVPWSLPWSRDPFQFYKVLLGVTAAALVYRITRRQAGFPWAGLLLLAITAKMSLGSYRHVPLFLLSAAAFGPMLAGELPWRRLERLVMLAPVAAAAWVIVSLAGGLHLQVLTQPGPEASYFFPFNAARFIKANHLGGNLAVWFDWGEFAIWELPQCKVSFDGRLETVYPPAIIDENVRFLQGQDLSFLDRYPVDLVLLPIDNPAARRMHDERPDWQAVYADPGVVLFVRRRDLHASYLQPRLGLDPPVVPLTGPPSVRL